jgi:hypothetical protein
VVYVVDGGKNSGKVVEKTLAKLNVTNIRCYFDGIKAWKQVGGNIEFPKFIKFKVTFLYSVQTKLESEIVFRNPENHQKNHKVNFDYF